MFAIDSEEPKNNHQIAKEITLVILKILRETLNIYENFRKLLRGMTI